MSAFSYEALNNEGQVSQGVIEADGLRQARARMREFPSCSVPRVVQTIAPTQRDGQDGMGAI